MKLVNSWFITKFLEKEEFYDTNRIVDLKKNLCGLGTE